MKIQIKFFNFYYIIKMNRANSKNRYYKSIPNAFMSTDVSGNATIPTLPASFVSSKKGFTSYLERPGTKITSQAPINSEIGKNESIKNNRSGLGDNTLFRDGFRDQGPQPRKVISYEIANLTPTIPSVTLSDKTLQDLFQVQTVDPNDFVWLAEYKRRKDLGDSDDDLKNRPPLGRSQRTIFKTVNFAEATALNTLSSLSLDEQLKALKEAVTSSGADVAKILAKVLELSTKFDTFTNDNILTMSDILNSTKAIDPDPKVYFGASGYHRIWSKTEVENSTLMIPYLLANVPSARYPLLTPVEPVIGGGSGRIKLKALLIALAVGTKSPVYDITGKLADPKYIGYANYLDIDNRTVISRDQAIAIVETGGFDSGMLDGLPPPPILTSGGILKPGNWNTIDEDDTASDLASKASTSKTPKKGPKVPKPPPKT